MTTSLQINKTHIILNAIRHYIECHQNHYRSLSIADTHRYLNSVIENCPKQNENLIEMISKEALRHGLAIHFDTTQHTKGKNTQAA